MKKKLYISPMMEVSACLQTNTTICVSLNKPLDYGAIADEAV